MSPARVVFCAMWLLICGVWPASAENKPSPSPVTLLTGAPDSVALRMGADLQQLLDGEDGLSLTTALGHGPVENLTDLFIGRNADAAIVQADTLAYAKREELLDGFDREIGSLAKLGNADIHIIASRKISSLADLAGKRVNIGSPGDPRFVTGSLVFSLLNIPITPTNGDLSEALAEIAAGYTDAAIIVARKPCAAVAALPSQSFRLLDIPGSAAIDAIYSPALYTASDYPLLVAKGGAVSSLSVSVVLAAAKPENPQEETRLKKLAKALYANAGLFPAGERYATWADTNFSADVPGWTRLQLANEVLSRIAPATLQKDKAEAAALAVDDDITDDQGTAQGETSQ